MSGPAVDARFGLKRNIIQSLMQTKYPSYELRVRLTASKTNSNCKCTHNRNHNHNRIRNRNRSHCRNATAGALDTQLLPVEQTKAATHIFGIGAKGQHNGSGGYIPHCGMHGEVIVLDAIVETLPAQAHRIH